MTWIIAPTDNWSRINYPIMAAAGRKNGELLIGKRAGGGESIFWNYSTKFALLYNVQGLKVSLTNCFQNICKVLTD